MGLKVYSRICPNCSRAIQYSTYSVYWKARKNNSRCRSCFYSSLIGRIVSEETKKRIGEANKIALLGNVPPNKGKAMSEEQKRLLSKIHTGKKMSDTCRKKHRVNNLKRHVASGIPLNEDIGAKKFISEFNKKHGYSFEPKYFFDLGYIADGYDARRHAWLEFDPPHHFYVDGSLKSCDVTRQNNIIAHFEKSGNPITEFIRVKADKSGNPLKITTVYERKDP